MSLVTAYLHNLGKITLKNTVNLPVKLTLIVKNHGFVDGNKRIAAACFLLFLEKNQMLYNRDGEAIISNDALASLTLFVAASKPESLSRRRSGKWTP